jgi:multidrug efflux system membrane fusion protein
MKLYANIKNTLVIVVAIATLFSCEEQSVINEERNTAPQVAVASVVHERISEWDEFTGRLQAAQTVALKPRVSGYIQKVLFTEGALVEEGDLLIQLDPAPFQSEVTRLRAKLGSAQAAARLARSNLERAEQLSGQEAISAEILDSRRAVREQAGAQVRSATAALRKAQLDLSYTRITAPISGRVSYALITAGNFVSAGQTQLTSLVSLDKMHAYFEVDEQRYWKLTQQEAANQWTQGANGQANPVYMSLQNETNEYYLGYIDFVDNSVNQATGTIKLRATFDNTERNLIPGLYAHIKLHSSEAYHGILIDDKAIGTDLNNKYVLVSNDEVLEYRAVSLGDKIHGLRIVKQGLKANEKIVVNGLQRVRAKMRISAKMVDMVNAETLSQLRNEQQLVEQSSLALTAQVLRLPNHG